MSDNNIIINIDYRNDVILTANEIKTFKIDIIRSNYNSKKKSQTDDNELQFNTNDITLKDLCTAPKHECF